MLAVLGLIGLSLQFSHAQPLSGELDLDVTAAPVYDLSGPWTFNQNLIGVGDQPTPLSFGMSLDISPNGKLFADGVTMVVIGNDWVAANFRARGSSSGGGTKPSRLTLTVTLTGEDTISGVLTKFKINANYTLDVAVGGGSMIGKASGSASLGKLGNASFRDKNYSIGIPRDTGGNWQAHASLLPLNKISGSGYVQLPDPSGINLPGEITGSYSKNSGVSTLNFKGVGSGKGTKVRIRATPGALVEIDGVILGQKVKE